MTVDKVAYTCFTDKKVFSVQTQTNTLNDHLRKLHMMEQLKICPNVTDEALSMG